MKFSGFGEQTAQTFWGRLATIIYAVFGIALFILFMASFRVLVIALINKVIKDDAFAKIIVYIVMQVQGNICQYYFLNKPSVIVKMLSKNIQSPR